MPSTLCMSLLLLIGGARRGPLRAGRVIFLIGIISFTLASIALVSRRKRPER